MRIPRRRLGPLAAAALTFGWGSTLSGQPPPPARSVVLVSIDSLRADHLSLYGYPRVTMPHLAARAAQLGAVVFDRVTAVTSSCHPSHTAILTGLYPHQVGVPGCGEDFLAAVPALDQEEEIQDLEELQEELKGQPPALVRKKLSAVMNWLSIPPQVETLATFFQKRGFRTGGFTSIWTVERRFGYANGFDTFVDAMPEYYGPTKLAWLLKDLMRSQRRQIGAATVDAALSFVEAVPPGERFFLFLHLADTHVPYNGRTAPAFEDSPAETARLEATWRERYPAELFERAMKVMRRGSDGNAPDPLLLDRYDHAIRYVDEQLERVFSELERRKLLDTTLVLVTADHGDSFGQHRYLSGRFANRLFFEHSVQVWEETQHIPLILFSPTVPKTPSQETPSSPRLRRDGRNVSQVDIAPTLVAGSGFPPADFGDEVLPGRSLQVEGYDAERPVFFMTFGRGRPGILRHLEVDFPKFVGLRVADTKFFVDRDRFKNGDRGRCFLFDLAADPGEFNNLCPRPENKDRASRYRGTLVDWYSTAAEIRRKTTRRDLREQRPANSKGNRP